MHSNNVIALYSFPAASVQPETIALYPIPNEFFVSPRRKIDSAKILKAKSRLYHMPRKAIRDTFSKHAKEILGDLQSFPFMRDNAKNLLLALFHLGHITTVARIEMTLNKPGHCRPRNLLCPIGKFRAHISEKEIIGFFAFPELPETKRDRTGATHIIPMPFISRHSLLKLPLSANSAGELERLIQHINQKLAKKTKQQTDNFSSREICALEDLLKAIEWIAIRINKERRTESKHLPVFQQFQEHMADGGITTSDLWGSNHEGAQIREIFTHNKGNAFATARSKKTPHTRKRLPDMRYSRQ